MQNNLNNTTYRNEQNTDNILEQNTQIQQYNKMI